MKPGFQTELTGLTEKGGRLWLEGPISVRYLRPLTGRQAIVFLDKDEREVATIANIDTLDEPGRSLVQAELTAFYNLTIVRRVDHLQIKLGTRFWTVDTDRGPRTFALREPGKNITWLSDTHLVLRDTAGNRFEIPDLDALDSRSRRLVVRFT